MCMRSSLVLKQSVTQREKKERVCYPDGSAGTAVGWERDAGDAGALIIIFFETLGIP